MSHYAKEQSKKELMQKKILQDSELARQQFEMFERIYRNLKVAEKKYLKSNSIE
jgi:hypothetical protein